MLWRMVFRDTLQPAGACIFVRSRIAGTTKSVASEGSSVRLGWSSSCCLMNSAAPSNCLRFGGLLLRPLKELLAAEAHLLRLELVNVKLVIAKYVEAFGSRIFPRCEMAAAAVELIAAIENHVRCASEARIDKEEQQQGQCLYSEAASTRAHYCHCSRGCSTVSCRCRKPSPYTPRF